MGSYVTEVEQATAAAVVVAAFKHKDCEYVVGLIN